MRKMIYLFTAAYLLAASIIVVETYRVARKMDRRNTLRRQLHAWNAEQRVAAAADNLPPQAHPQAHPQCRSVIQPAYLYDASDTTEELVDYCPACALQSVVAQGYRTADGDYPLPRGQRVLCGDHTAKWEERLEEDDHPTTTLREMGFYDQ